MNYLPDVPRHALFGDAEDENILHIIPESEVHIRLVRSSSGTDMFAHFKNKVVKLPRGSAVSFLQLQAITASGGIGFAESQPSSPPSPLIRPGSRA